MRTPFDRIELRFSVLRRAHRRLERAFLRVDREAMPLTISRTEGTPGAEVKLWPASLVRPSVMVELALPYRDDEHGRRLALSHAAWDGLDDFEAWRALAQPLSGLPHLGRPQPARPWILTHTPRAFVLAKEIAAQSGGQVHVVGGDARSLFPWKRDVFWPVHPTVAAALLGRAHQVVANGAVDPLALDALRAGVPVVGSHGAEHCLVGLIPPSLLDDEEHWLHVARAAQRVRQGHAPEALLCPAWIERGRGAARQRADTEGTLSGWQLAARRIRKLEREPERFFAESKHRVLQRAGRWWFERRKGSSG